MRQWVTVDTHVLKNARAQRGLSYEAVGRQLNCAAKTYERYEKQSRIPLDLIDRVADVLGLELERPAFTPGRVTVMSRGAVEPQQDGGLQELLLEVVGRLELIADRLDGQVAQRPARGVRKPA